MGLQIIPLPCLQDNYAYLIVCEETGHAAVVDPSEALPIQKALDARKLTLSAILNTHHHWDHTGGNLELKAAFPGIPIYGHRSDAGRIAGQTGMLDTGDTLEVGKQEGRVLHIPGHTLGAIAYVFDDAVFTGDTLFGGGCGRLFEGTPEMMFISLNDVLASLSGPTRVYFGHEYTQKNLEFALTLEPCNDALRRRKATVDAMRRNGEFSVPSTIAEELATNPFMRCHSLELVETLRRVHGLNPISPVDILSAVRTLKDHF